MTPDECHLDDAARWLESQLGVLTLYAALAVLPTRYGEIAVEETTDSDGDDAVLLSHRGYARGFKKDKDKRDKAAKEAPKAAKEAAKAS